MGKFSTLCGGGKCHNSPRRNLPQLGAMRISDIFFWFVVKKTVFLLLMSMSGRICYLIPSSFAANKEMQTHLGWWKNDESKCLRTKKQYKNEENSFVSSSCGSARFPWFMQQNLQMCPESWRSGDANHLCWNKRQMLWAKCETNHHGHDSGDNLRKRIGRWRKNIMGCRHLFASHFCIKKHLSTLFNHKLFVNCPTT